MSDAAEVLESVCDALREVEGGADLVDSVFGLRVAESVQCSNCGHYSHMSEYTQNLYTAPATALRMLASTLDEVGPPPQPFCSFSP